MQKKAKFTNCTREWLKVKYDVWKCSHFLKCLSIECMNETQTYKESCLHRSLVYLFTIIFSTSPKLSSVSTIERIQYILERIYLALVSSFKTFSNHGTWWKPWKSCKVKILCIIPFHTAYSNKKSLTKNNLKKSWFISREFPEFQPFFLVV